jgi:hypothetical protein
MNDREIGVRTGKARDFFFLHNIQICLGLIFYPEDTGGSFPEGKMAGV